MRRLKTDDAQGAGLLDRPRLARVLIASVLTALALLFLWLTIRVDLVLFGGLLLAAFLRITARRLTARTGLALGWSLFAVVLTIAAMILGLVWLSADTLAGQVGEISQRLPHDLAQIAQSLSQTPIGRSVLSNFHPQDLVTMLSSKLSDIAGALLSFTEAVAGVVIIGFIGVYVAADVAPYRSGLLCLVPQARRARVAAVLEQTAETLWYWVLGRLFSMTVLGTLTGIGLWLLGVPAALALGVLSGLLIFVPYIGAVVSAVPSVILAFAISGRTALYAIGLYVAIHILEGYLLVPLVQRRATHLPPALGLSGQLILGVLAGLIGLLFATPLLLAALVLVRTLYVEDVLGDRGAA